MLKRFLRLFSYVRQLEQQVDNADKLTAKLIEDSDWYKHNAELFQSYLERAHQQSIDDRNERRWLQDRLLERSGSNPIYPSSPGEQERRTIADAMEPIARARGPRERAVELSAEHYDDLRKDIDAQVIEFKKQQNGGSTA